MNVPEFLSGWKIGGIVLALLASGAGIGATMTSRQLSEHVVQTDSLLAEIRAIRRAQETQVCLQVAQLRKGDWTTCLVK